MLRKLTPAPVNSWFADRYGSRRGFLLTWWHRMLYRVGSYRGYRQVDWASIDRLVFVCKGNVCRSAFAEVVARADGLQAVSCGIEAGDGVPANDGAIAAAARRGFSLEEHRTTPLRDLELKATDLLVAMEPGQALFLRQAAGSRSACTLLGLWATEVTPHIVDPYGASASYFNHCFDFLENAVHEIDRKITQAARR